MACDMKLNNLGNSTWGARYVTVCLKNSTRLERLINWLHSDPVRAAKLRILIIDDEADQAGINTAKMSEYLTNEDIIERTAINQYLVNLANGKNADGTDTNAPFQAMNYVSFTATPYANVLNEAFEESLYPKDFICSLPESNEYFGTKVIFGSCSDDSFPGLNIVRTVPEEETKELKVIHKGNASDLPTQFKKSVCWFLCSAAILRLRGHQKPISMLVHTTAMQRSHFEEYDILKNWLLRGRSSGEILSLCESVYAVEKDEFTLEDLRNSYPKYGRINEVNGEFPDFVDIKPEIELLLSHIENIMMAEDRSTDYHKDAIHLCVDNCGANKHAEEGTYLRVVYPSSGQLAAMDKAPVFIVLGGNTLARGLTLEGLVCTYFARNANQADTLMQMGRWFGYRPGYVDVCRLFVSEEINNWFKAITIANNELREEFDYLWESKGSPQQYALKVRTSPGLLITSPLKMFSTKDVQISWASTLVETYSLVRSKEAIRHNYDLTSKFIKNLGQRHLNDGADDPRGFLWTDVPVNAICDYIGSFNIADTSRIKLDLEKMVDYIKTCNSEYGELNSWRVLVRNNKEKMFGAHTADSGQSEYYFNAPNIPRGICTNRTRVNIPDQDDNVYNLRNYHLISGPNDEFIDFYILGEESLYLKGAITETRDIKKRQHEENPNVKEWDKDYPSPVLVRQQYRPADKPFLIIYPLNPEKANIYRDGILKEGVEQYKANELPFIAFAIVFPNSQNSRGFKYKVNEVKELIESELNFENENDNEYADE
jgi:hypothetical protein